MVPIQSDGGVNPVWYEKLKFLELLQPLSDIVFPVIPPPVDISGKSNITRTINLVPGSAYTLALTDAGNVIWFQALCTVTIPPNSTVNFPVGTQIDVIQGAGKVTFAAGSGVGLNSLNGNKSIAGQYAGGTLLQVGTNSWVLMGSLTV
jgi:hypothetical protein